MRISQLIEALEEAETEHGDLDVYIPSNDETFSASFSVVQVFTNQNHGYEITGTEISAFEENDYINPIAVLGI